MIKLSKLVLGLRPYDHTTARAQRQLHWLPVYYRVQYKLCILMYSIANQEAPVYLRELVKQTSEMASRSNLRSSVNNAYVKFHTRTKFGQRVFSTAGPLAWNALPSGGFRPGRGGEGAQAPSFAPPPSFVTTHDLFCKDNTNFWFFWPFITLEKRPNLRLPLNVQKPKVLQLQGGAVPPLTPWPGALPLEPAGGSAPRPPL